MRNTLELPGIPFQANDMRSDYSPEVQVDVKDPRLERIRKVITSIPFQIFITFLTVYSLVGDDIRVIAFTKPADVVFDGITITLLSIFSIEILLSSLSINGYWLSFFFFLDIISTVSLLLDISMLTEAIYQGGNAYSFSKLASQSRASRAATRAVRIVKLFRIIRIVKLYKSAVKASEKKQEEKIKNKTVFLKSQPNQRLMESTGSSGQEIRKKQELRKGANPGIEETQERMGQMQREQLRRKQRDGQIMDQDTFSSDIIDELGKGQSKISKLLTQITLKKVIIVVLLLMFLVPLFDAEIYSETAISWDFTVGHIEELLLRPTEIPLNAVKELLNKVIASHENGENQNLLYFSSPFNELPYYQKSKYLNARSSELAVSVEQVNVNTILAMRPELTVNAGLDDLFRQNIYAVMDRSQLNKKESLFSISKTVFVCIILLGLLHFFSKDIDQMIVLPIENMMRKLLNMARDPESASKEEINYNAEYETTVVSNAIVKIGALLSVVYGSAGAEIIGENILREGDMNPLIEGKKKCAIFGFCDIRNFTEVTQVLQEDILLFVNKIGRLVHQAVYRYGGSANKNIGQAFLLIWKIPNTKYQINQSNNQITWKDPRYLSILADFSVLSFVKALIKIHKDPDVIEYHKDERLCQKFGQFNVKMGYGLHIGWAIQGAIGSQYKIDASYLSPNVNMAARLQAATKQFGVNLLISEDLYKVLTKGMQHFCRMIDRVTVKGSKKPIRLYTVDLNYDKISPPTDKHEKYPNPTDIPDAQVKRAINLEYLKEHLIEQYDAETQVFISNKKELRQAMLNSLSEQFRFRFQEGVEAYLNGKWNDSKLHLTHALKLRSNDGPTKRLLSFIGNYNYIAPQGWANFRELTSK